MPAGSGPPAVVARSESAGSRRPGADRGKKMPIVRAVRGGADHAIPRDDVPMTTLARIGLMGVVVLVSVMCVVPEVRVTQSAPSALRCRTLIDAEGRDTRPRVRWLQYDRKDGRGHDAWCRAVGPALSVAPASIIPTIPMAKIALVTWNAHVGAGDVRALVDALRGGRLTDGVPVRDFVILLQEVFRAGAMVPDTGEHDAVIPREIRARPPSGDRRDILTTATALRLFAFYVPSMRNGSREGDGAEDRGNAILSTRPLSDLTAIELPLVQQRRVAIAATIAAVTSAGTEWRLRLASAHLDTRAGAGRLWLFASGTRGLQAKALADALSDREVPTVLGADLNTWSEGPREPAYFVLADAFPDTPEPGIHGTFRGGWRLDYLFFRLPGRWRADLGRVSNRYGSDHNPLLAWVGQDAH
jgi:endonuclease/exonuclease/phosphatase family metal-dependent hydrolase